MMNQERICKRHNIPEQCHMCIWDSITGRQHPTIAELMAVLSVSGPELREKAILLQ